MAKSPHAHTTPFSRGVFASPGGNFRQAFFGKNCKADIRGNFKTSMKSPKVWGKAAKFGFSEENPGKTENEGGTI